MGKYSLSYSASAIRRNESRLIAIVYLELGDWESTRRKVVGENLIQMKASSSALRISRELIKRLRTLSNDELEFLANASPAGQDAILWVAVCRTYEFIAEFATEVLHDRFVTQKSTITKGSYEFFYEAKCEVHPELAALAESTRKKLQVQVFLMLRDLRYINERGEIQEFIPSSEFVALLGSGNRNEMFYFPIGNQ